MTYSNEDSLFCSKCGKSNDVGSLFCSNCGNSLKNEEIVEEVDSNEYRCHKSDIEVCNEHYCERNNVVYLSSVVNKIFDSQCDKGQEHCAVQPHRVDSLDDNITHHSVSC